MATIREEPFGRGRGKRPYFFMNNSGRPQFKEPLPDEPPKLGICLCGGGLVGAFYETGVLKALDEFLGPGSVRGLFDIWVGTSAGASVAGFLSQGVSPARLYQALWNFSDPFFPFQRADVFQFDLKRWGRTLGGIALQAVKAGLFDFLRMPGTPSADWITELQQQLPGGFFSLERYQKTYEEALRRNGLSNSFFELSRELIIPTVELDTARRCVFAKGCELETTAISTAIAASSAIPGFFEPVRVGDRSFVDGGTGRAAHIDLAFERGARSILVVNPIVPVRLTRPHQNLLDSSIPVGSIATRGLFKVWSQSSRIGTSERVKMGLKRFAVEHPDVKVFLIEPPADDATMFLFGMMDERSRHRILEHGYRSTLRTLEKQGDKLRELTTPARARWQRPALKVHPETPRTGEFHVLGPEGEEDERLVGTGW